jgi:hypothetical protein
MSGDHASVPAIVDVVASPMRSPALHGSFADYATFNSNHTPDGTQANDAPPAVDRRTVSSTPCEMKIRAAGAS